MDNKVTWIQISDIHLGDNSAYSKKCREALLEYAKNAAGNIDYIFITGDIIFAKGKGPLDRTKAYNEAVKFVKKMYTLLWGEDDSITDMSKRIFVVPGNHDLKRNKARIGCISSLLTSYNESEKGVIDYSYLENTVLSMSDFFVFYRKITSNDIVSQAKQRIHYVIETDKINVLHINTCVASCNDGDDGKLIIGFELLNNALEKIKNNKPTIAIAHHNFDCLNKNDQKRLEILLKEKNISLYLCGHAHERESNLVSRTNQIKRLDTFTCGTLMPIEGDMNKNDSVFYRGIMDLGTLDGQIHAFAWDLENGWHDDKRFGLVQGVNDNYRFFCTKNDIDYRTISKRVEGEKGIISKIVSQQSYQRNNAFMRLNDKAKESLSIYGIGITSVSKNTELFDRILDSGGRIKLCMVDPHVFKSKECFENSTKNKEFYNGLCSLKNTNFCIYANHIDEYIRKEYYWDIMKSFDRIMNYKKSLKEKQECFEIRIIKSFIPLSINIINEDAPKSELIIEYNMPFTTNRLLLELSNIDDNDYYTHIKDTFIKIWEMAEEVQPNDN